MIRDKSTSKKDVEIMAFNPVDGDTQTRVSQFLLHETGLLDRYCFEEWLSVVADDFTYVVPVPHTPADPKVSPWDENVFILDENKQSLANLWFKRLEPASFPFAWGENPKQRVRRFVSNTLVSVGDVPDSFIATSNVLLSFARQSDPVTLVSAGRIDHVRRDGESFKLVRRVVQLDQTVVSVAHMRLIF